MDSRDRAAVRITAIAVIYHVNDETKVVVDHQGKLPRAEQIPGRMPHEALLRTVSFASLRESTPTIAPERGVNAPWFTAQNLPDGYQFVDGLTLESHDRFVFKAHRQALKMRRIGKLAKKFQPADS